MQVLALRRAAACACVGFIRAPVHVTDPPTVVARHATAALFFLCFTILYGILILFYFLLLELYLLNVEDKTVMYIFFAIGIVAASALGLVIHWGNEEREMKRKAAEKADRQRAREYVRACCGAVVPLPLPLPPQLQRPTLCHRRSHTTSPSPRAGWRPRPTPRNSSRSCSCVRATTSRVVAACGARRQRQLPTTSKLAMYDPTCT